MSIRKYFINEHYFNTINAKKSYWLGILFGRSNLILINKKRQSIINIGVPYRNKYILESIKKEFASTYPIKTRIINGTKRCFLQFNSQKIYRRLLMYGYRSGGNGYIRFLPKRYLKHFYRGYFDRRGWFYRGSKKFYVTGNLDSLYKIKNYICDNICNVRVKILKRSNNLYSLLISNKKTVEKIVRYFYYNIKTTIKTKTILMLK